MNRICNTCKIENDLSMFAKYRYNGELLHKAKCQECNKPSKQNIIDGPSKIRHRA
jgi:hypothetical protein